MSSEKLQAECCEGSVCMFLQSSPRQLRCIQLQWQQPLPQQNKVHFLAFGLALSWFLLGVAHKFVPVHHCWYCNIV